MNQFRHIALVVCLVSAVLLATDSLAKSIDERKWHLLESDNFAIHSSMSRGKTLDLLNYLEALRSIFVRAGVTAEDFAEKPTVIVVVGKRSDFESLGFSDTTAGIFMPELRQNFIVISNSSRMQETQIILHEYIHYIMQATSRFPYPSWWREGFAEYASSSRLSKKGISIGMPLEDRLRTLDYLDWLPWEEIIDPARTPTRTHGDVSLFYAQSWLLVHYLFNREDTERKTSLSWQVYLDEIQSGAEPLEAFAKGFE